MSEENSNQPINNADVLQQRYAQGERDFSKANLAAADLRDMDLKGVNLQGANLTGAYLRGANFKQANLQEAILKESDLRGANLSAANLKGAYLSGASLELSIMQGANLQQANLRGANLGGAMLIGASLEKAELTFADLSDVYMISQGGSGGAILEGANLQGANLSKANLRGASLCGANLKEAQLKGAFPQGAYYDGRTHFPAGFDPANSGMQKIQISNKKSSSSAKSSSSLLKSKHFFSFATVSGIGLVLFPAGIIYTWTQINKSNSTGIAKAKSEVEVSYEANQPAAESDIEATIDANKSGAESDIEASIDANKSGAEPDIEANLKTHKPGAKPKIKVSLKANQPAAKSENTVKEANKPNSAATSQAKTGAKSENTVKEANKPNSVSTPNDKRNHAAAKPAGAISTVATQVASCPALVRTINAANPDKPSAVDISINGKQVFSNVPFSQASRYVSVSPGQLYIQIMKAGTKTLVDERRFAAAANTAYSVAVTGSLPGPSGQLLFNKSPFVIPEDLSPPSPGKFKGRWYKLSEMKVAIDLRIAKLDALKVTLARLVDVIPKTAAAYPELKAGTYNFNTALPNKSDPIINAAYKPPIRVEIAKAKIPAGTIFDVFAIGNDLGKKGRNSLKLAAASYKTLPPTAAGCTRVQ